MRGLVAESAGPLGSGGMATKLKAARQAARGGMRDYRAADARAISLARGARSHARDRHADTARRGTRLKSRKQWIAFALRPAGALAVDDGAAEALRQKGRSLLPSGIREVRGEFTSGDCVSLLDHEGSSSDAGWSIILPPMY